MSVDTLREKTGFSGRSPRISFSHELILSSRDKNMTVTPVQKPTADFDFGTLGREHESSTADELFSDGKLVPLRNVVKKPTPPTSKKPTETPRSSPQSHGKEAEAEDEGKAIANDEMDEKQASKSFWKVMRSKSFGGSGRSLCPLPLLSRSNSTGPPLGHHKQPNSQKSNATAAPSSPRLSQRPPLRKSSSGNSGSNLRVEPVLHVPTGNLFDLGSMFMSGKNKSKRK